MKTRIQKRHVKKAGLFVIVEATLLVLIIGGLLFFSPKIYGSEQDESGKLTFFKFKNAHAILIDDNSDFSSPQRISEKAMKLEAGKYYWKAEGILGESKTGEFEIESEVAISMKVENNVTTITNKGNVKEEIIQKGISGNMIIDVNENAKFETMNNGTLEVKQS